MTLESRSLVEQTAERLIQHIIKSEMKNGDRLPNETDLSLLLGVGRSTLREAVRMLASRNILEVRHGAGIFICKNTGIADDPLGFTFIKDKAKLISDLIEFRMLIEPRVAALAASNATPEQVEELSALADDVEQRYESGQSHKHEDAAFHAKLGQLSGNIIMPSLEPIIFNAIDLFIDMTQSVLKEETLRSHRAIVDAVRAGDATAAEDAMILHLIYNRDHLRRMRFNSEKAHPTE